MIGIATAVYQLDSTYGAIFSKLEKESLWS